MDDGDRPVEAIAFTELLAMVGGADLVKMDIEGAEWEVLASDGWEKLVETILVEVHGEPYEKMIDLLAARGFSASKHTAHWSSVWAVNSRG